jgi:hypothetical protein
MSARAVACPLLGQDGDAVLARRRSGVNDQFSTYPRFRRTASSLPS